MELPAFQAAKHVIQAWTGLEKDALHIYVGLGVFLCARALTRQRGHPWLAWVAVLLVALLGEVLDLHDDLTGSGHWRWEDSAHDIVNTMFWPTVLQLLLRRRQQDRKAETKRDA